jgi:hypothetical protein
MRQRSATKIPKWRQGSATKCLSGVKVRRVALKIDAACPIEFSSCSYKFVSSSLFLRKNIFRWRIIANAHDHQIKCFGSNLMQTEAVVVNFNHICACYGEPRLATASHS